MNSKLYVGNLAYETTERDLNELFAAAGTVSEATLIMDKMTGSSRGFGFVVMSSEREAQAAIDQFASRDFQGRNLAGNLAREREPRPASGGRGQREHARRH